MRGGSPFSGLSIGAAGSHRGGPAVFRWSRLGAAASFGGSDVALARRRNVASASAAGQSGLIASVPKKRSRVLGVDPPSRTVSGTYVDSSKSAVGDPLQNFVGRNAQDPRDGWRRKKTRVLIHGAPQSVGDARNLRASGRGKTQKIGLLRKFNKAQHSRNKIQHSDRIESELFT